MEHRTTTELRFLIEEQYREMRELENRLALAEYQARELEARNLELTARCEYAGVREPLPPGPSVRQWALAIARRLTQHEASRTLVEHHDGVAVLVVATRGDQSDLAELLGRAFIEPL